RTKDQIALGIPIVTFERPLSSYSNASAQTSTSLNFFSHLFRKTQPTTSSETFDRTIDSDTSLPRGGTPDFSAGTLQSTTSTTSSSHFLAAPTPKLHRVNSVASQGTVHSEASTVIEATNDPRIQWTRMKLVAVNKRASTLSSGSASSDQRRAASLLG
ncbi:hypothetical protein HK102_010944, partial [Quaeritorhiza haematococci]